MVPGVWLQVRICRERSNGKLVAVKKLKKAEMVRRGQVRGTGRGEEACGGPILFSRAGQGLLVGASCCASCGRQPRSGGRKEGQLRTGLVAFT